VSRVLILGALTGSVLVGLLVVASPASAQSRTPPEATQHALDELANCRAQRRPDCPTGMATPTFTTTPIPSPIPTPNPTPTPQPTVMPEPAPTDPPLPLLNVGQAVAAYVRPSPRDPSGTWLELALPQGRWAMLYDTTLCTQSAAWTNVWLALDDQGDRPITADRDDGATCAVSQWSWTSNAPCAEDDQGNCDVEFDEAYWDASGQVEPTATDTPIPTRSTAPPPTPRPPIALGAPPATAAPRVEVIVQTVVVVVTSVPTAKSIPTRTTALTPTPVPTRTATLTPSPTNTPTLEPTSTEVAPLVASVSATQVPTVVAQSVEPAAAPTSWSWRLTFVVLAGVIGLAAIWLVVARSGPVMW
jgi:hypothetical protein